MFVLRDLYEGQCYNIVLRGGADSNVSKYCIVVRTERPGTRVVRVLYSQNTERFWVGPVQCHLLVLSF